MGRLLLATAMLVALVVLGDVFAPRADAYIYWAKGGGGGIGRANVDGSDMRPNFIPATSDCGVAVDGEHVYWVNRPRATADGSIGRANLDGTGVQQNFIPVPKGSDACGVAVDDQHIYWGNRFANSIGRAHLDGTNVDQSFIPNQHWACGVGVDSAHVYWDPGVGRANLDGTGVQSFVPGSGCGVAVHGNYVYWVNSSDGRHPGTIGRANLDGSGVNQGFANGGSPCGIAVDDGYVYWMDKASGSIGRISLDRSDFEPRFIQTGAQLACGLAVDQAGPAARVIRLGKPKRNKQRGTAKLPVTVPGSGALKLRPKGHGLKRVSRDVHSAGKVRLPVTPRGRKKNRLNHHGRARVEAQITFTPTNGSSTTRSRKIKLVKR